MRQQVSYIHSAGALVPKSYETTEGPHHSLVPVLVPVLVLVPFSPHPQCDSLTHKWSGDGQISKLGKKDLRVPVSILLLSYHTLSTMRLSLSLIVAVFAATYSGAAPIFGLPR